MSQAWSKVRSLMRGAFTAPEAPTETARATPAPPAPSAPPIHRDVPSATHVDPTDLGRAVDARTKTLGDRIEHLEAMLRQTSGTSQAATPAASVNEGRLATLGAELVDLRAAFADVVRQHDALRGANEELSRQVSALSELVHGLSRRVGETARDARGAQAIADETSARADATRDELQQWLESRSRDLGTRLAPLYVVSLIAILAALAAAVFSAIHLMS